MTKSASLIVECLFRVGPSISRLFWNISSGWNVFYRGPNFTWHKIHYEHIKLLLVTSKWVKWPTCSYTDVYALATVASLEIKAHKKASRDVDKQIDTKQVLCSSKKVLSCCWLARSVEEVLSWHHHHKIKYTWSSTSQWYLQASPIGGCLHDEVQSYVVGLQRIHEPPSTI